MSGKREELENVMALCFIIGVLGNQINLVGTARMSYRKIYDDHTHIYIERERYNGQ